MSETIIANTPEAVQNDELRQRAEDQLKAELLKELSLDDIRQMVSAVKSGVLTNPHDAPDTFDEYGRNFRRMIHLLDVSGNSGETYQIERPMARTLEEARKEKSDWFDIDNKTWVLYGYKRQADYPENTKGYILGAGAV